MSDGTTTNPFENPDFYRKNTEKNFLEKHLNSIKNLQKQIIGAFFGLIELQEEYETISRETESQERIKKIWAKSKEIEKKKDSIRDLIDKINNGSKLFYNLLHERDSQITIPQLEIENREIVSFFADISDKNGQGIIKKINDYVLALRAISDSMN